MMHVLVNYDGPTMHPAPLCGRAECGRPAVLNVLTINAGRTASADLCSQHGGDYLAGRSDLVRTLRGA